MKRQIVRCLVGLLLTIPLIGPGVKEASAEAAGVRLLFAYSGTCSHCSYQRPIMKEFEGRHPEVEVTWTNYYDLDSDQKQLIKGTSGHPVMVFHDGCDTRQVVGETSLATLEREYVSFKESAAKKDCQRRTTGSGIVCR